MQVVREGEHAGDPAQLRDAGHVPPLRGHRLRLAALQDPPGTAWPLLLAEQRPGVDGEQEGPSCGRAGSSRSGGGLGWLGPACLAVPLARKKMLILVPGWKRLVSSGKASARLCQVQRSQALLGVLGVG